jgi:hypothetical protein
MNKHIADSNNAGAEFRPLTDIELDMVGGGFWGLPQWACTALLIAVAIGLAA